MFSLLQNTWGLISMINNRIPDTFARLKGNRKTALVAYVMGGDPDSDTTIGAMRTLRDNGADVIELGFPFTDPTADGVSIQKAGLRSLEANTTLISIFEIVKKFREDDNETPLILMGYANPVHSMGYRTFAANCSRYGVDGVIVVDLPAEEDQPLREHFEHKGISIIRLVTPTTTPERLKIIAHKASGFVYYVAVAGITGTKSANPDDIRSGIEAAQRATKLPVCVGFGIRTGEQARAMSEIADGIVVGSAFVEVIEKTVAENKNASLLVKENLNSRISEKLGILASELSSAISTNS